MKKYLLLLLIWGVTHSVQAQLEDLSQVWPAKWIMPSDAPAKEYSVHHFRKTFTLDSIPQRLIIHTSGDNRYQLYVNGQLATWGPLRGDLRHWYYESTDIASFLQSGKNVIAAVVLNYGAYPPDAQLSVQTGFLLAANDRTYRYLNTNPSWKSKHSLAYSPSIVTKQQVTGYYGAGAKERVDGRQYLWGWEETDFNDSDWITAQVVENAFAKTCRWASRWKLTPRSLPHERLTPGRFKQVRIAEQVTVPEEFPTQATAITVPPATKARLVLDWGEVTTAYPMLTLSGGQDAEITFTYAEAPYIGSPRDKQKGNRSEVEGKHFVGVSDAFIADGGSNRIFQPLWWRAYRYVEVTVQTYDQALTINDISAIRSTYPFEQRAQFDWQTTNDSQLPSLLSQIQEIGHRTVMACSHEHFMDCPYYEESQFQGDTRVAALVSYYNYGDPVLGKQAIEQFAWSINDEGFLSARYPTNSLYYIPNFSIYWIGMLYDYMMLHDDRDFIVSQLPVMRMIMNYFARHERPDGTLRRLDYHQFVDWSFKAGEPPIDEQGYSAVVDLHYLLALQWSTALEKEVGEAYFADLYRNKAEKLLPSIQNHYWNAEVNLFTDLPGDATHLSQHTNCLAVLSGIVEGQQAQKVIQKVFAVDSLTQASLYWQFYVFEALHRAGLGTQYLNRLGAWEEMVDLGVTTWPETGPHSRSECHAWGASPNYHLLKIVAGITPLTPGFKQVRIAPQPGEAEALECSVPHHRGEISLSMQKKQKGWTAEVTLPPETTGSFVWQGKETLLNSGKQKLVLE